MISVWKFPVPVQDELHVEMPAKAAVVHFGPDPQGQLCIWARINSLAAKEIRRFRLAGTGHDLGAAQLRHVASCVHRDAFVWHLFEEA